MNPINPRLLLLLAAAILPACHTAPTAIVRADGTRLLNLGTSLLEKSTAESASLKTPDGYELSYSKTGKDETGVANMAIGTWGTVAGITASGEQLNQGEAIRENNQTARQVSNNSVKKAQIQGDVTKATFVPPEP